MRAVADEQVNVVGRHLARDDLQLVLDRNLPQEIARSDRHRAGQHPLAVLGNPDEVDLEIVARVATEAVSSHDATSPILPSPEGEGLTPRWGTIIGGLDYLFLIRLPQM